MIETEPFISDLRHAFGPGLKLPVAVWRSAEAAGEDPCAPHCLFAALPAIEEGSVVSFSKASLHCGGGRFYCGFSPPNPGISNFVSRRERYKQTPEMVDEIVAGLRIMPASLPYVNMARIDRLESLDAVDGVFFLAGADAISGLCAWAFFDNNSPDAVSCLFGSGCCSVITSVVAENGRKGRRTFIGMTDLSAREFVAKDELGFAIPACRLEEMAVTLRESCLWESPAWSRIRSRG